MTRTVIRTLGRKERRHAIERGGKQGLLQTDLIAPASQPLQDGALAALFKGRRLTRARRARLRESYLLIVSSGLLT
jgi:hypothetical protein